MSQHPNILLICTDQHRLSAVGCYGPTVCRTPSIDRLAATGTRFDRSYTSCPVCSPARATIMTGEYPHTHGICSNVHNLGASVHELADGAQLLSRQLQQRGYACGYTGKWHLGSGADRAFAGACVPALPRDLGFSGQDFPGHGGGGFGYPEYKEFLARNGFTHQVHQARTDCTRVWPYGVLRGPVESTVPWFLTDHSIDWMEQNSDSEEPFFLWHNFWGPHGPFYVPRDCYDEYAGAEIDEWPNYRWPGARENAPYQVKRHPLADHLEWEDWAEAIRHYYAFTTLIDSQIGRLLEYLDRSKLAEDTVVVFTADHGQTLGSHGGLTDKGWHHFEEIQRIPLIVRLPGGRRGAVRHELVSLVDLYPTLMELAGVDSAGESLPGRSLMPLLHDQDVPWRDTAVVEFNGVNSLATTMVTLRRGDLKYGWNCSSFDELYDLATDPHETINLAGSPEYAQQLLDLRQCLAEWMRQSRHPGLGMYEFSRLGIQRLP
jgi:arylsulfatase A-like enzyme